MKLSFVCKRSLFLKYNAVIACYKSKLVNIQFILPIIYISPYNYKLALMVF